MYLVWKAQAECISHAPFLLNMSATEQVHSQFGNVPYPSHLLQTAARCHSLSVRTAQQLSPLPFALLFLLLYTEYYNYVNYLRGASLGDLGAGRWIILERILWGSRREGDYWGDLGVHGWIILEWTLVGKPEGRRLLGRPRRRWVNNIRMDLGGENGGKETTGET